MTDNLMSLAGKTVVAIGGSSGIGFAIARLARELEAEVVIASSDPAKVAAAVARLPGARGEVVDVRDEASVAAFFERLGGLDHLTLTSGDWGGSMFTATRDIDLAQAQARLQVRLWGAVAAIKHASGVIAQDGSITLTSGMLAHRPQKGGALAAMGGGATEYLARALAVDLAPVRVNVVVPGLILTEPVLRMPQEMRTAFTARLPIPRAATPEEAAMAYIGAMLNGYVTGQTLFVDGGGLVA
jgi:NAD(P)-dependent dehydrogenase (short-subunit alcohol dehydrogenase family)